MFQRWIARLERYSDRWWYFPSLGFLAGLDFFVVFIPTDGLLISAVMVAPRRWVRAVVCFGIGSTAGGVLFAALVQRYGLSVLTRLAPGLESSAAWVRATHWVDHYGLAALVGWMALPMVQQPPVALVALSGVSLFAVCGAILAGRAVKYGVFAWLASHAPEKLLRFKRIRREVEHVHPLDGGGG